MKKINYVGSLFFVVLAQSAFAADPVNLAGETEDNGSQAQLTLTSTDQVTLRLNFVKAQSSIVGAESGVSAQEVMVRAVSGTGLFSNVVVSFSTTCTRISPDRGSPFTNQTTADFKLATGPHDFPFAVIPLDQIVLQKDVHGGEFHTCQANLGFTVNGQTQFDPITKSSVFHPQF